tara:strand:- start:2538 stop:3227 length:690 start_codon:yes stop_codon:yes gene_type:complete
MTTIIILLILLIYLLLSDFNKSDSLEGFNPAKEIKKIQKELNQVKKLPEEIKKIMCRVTGLFKSFSQLGKNAKNFWKNFTNIFKNIGKAIAMFFNLALSSIQCVDELLFDFLRIKYTLMVKNYWGSLSWTTKAFIYFIMILMLFILWPLMFMFAFMYFLLIAARFIYRNILYYFYRKTYNKYYNKPNKCTVSYVQKRFKTIEKTMPSMLDVLNSFNVTKIFELKQPKCK